MIIVGGPPAATINFKIFGGSPDKISIFMYIYFQVKKSKIEELTKCGAGSNC